MEQTTETPTPEQPWPLRWEETGRLLRLYDHRDIPPSLVYTVDLDKDPDPRRRPE